MSSFPCNSYLKRFLVQWWSFFRKCFNFIVLFSQNANSISKKMFYYIKKIRWNNIIIKIIYVTLVRHILKLSYYTINETFRIISFFIFVRNKFYFFVKLWYAIRSCNCPSNNLNLNPLSASVTLAQQIIWLVSIWVQHWYLMG